MIDWLTFIAPLEHDQSERGPFYAGEILSTQPDPTHPDGFGLEWATLKRKSVEGSFSTSIQVRSVRDDEGRPALWVHGNPSKWFQGHNVFGSDDLPGLVGEMLSRICQSFGVVPSASDRAAWAAGDIHLTRVDVTYSFDLGTLPRVRNALRSLDSSAHLKHRGRGHFMGDSLVFGKGSRRWSLTFYAKGSEIQKHKLPESIACTSVPVVAQGLLRAECRLLGMQLQELGLDRVSAWGDNTAAEVHFGLVGGLQVAEKLMIDTPVLEGLPGRLQLAYQAWRDGHDLRSTLSRPTFYRYRSELLKHGVDIAVKQERTSADMTNVVPLRTVLHAVPFSTPDWAVGTSLYFEPRATAA